MSLNFIIRTFWCGHVLIPPQKRQEGVPSRMDEAVGGGRVGGKQTNLLVLTPADDQHRLENSFHAPPEDCRLCLWHRWPLVVGTKEEACHLPAPSVSTESVLLTPHFPRPSESWVGSSLPSTEPAPTEVVEHWGRRWPDAAQARRPRRGDGASGGRV